VNFIKLIIGVGIIIGGGFLEFTWLCFLFGSVLGVILVLILAPHLLLLPWHVCLALGLSFMGSADDVGEALSSTGVVCKKATRGLIRIFRVVVVIAIVGSIVVGLALLYKNHNDKRVAQEERKAAQELREVRAKALENRVLRYGQKWSWSGKFDSTGNRKVATIASIVSSDGRCELTVQKRLNGAQLTGLECLDIKIPEYRDIYVQFNNNQYSEKMNLESYSDSDDVYIPSGYQDYMSYQNFIKGLVSSNTVSIKIPCINEDFWVQFSLKGSSKAINKLGKEM